MRTPAPISTPRLVLHPVTLPLCEALIEGEATIAPLLQVSTSPEWGLHSNDIWGFSREMLLAAPESAGWWGWLVIHAADNCLIGTCGYKGRPEDGVMEIGYEISVAYRNQGFAREAAGALVDRAFGFAEVHTVMAHTLPEANASTHVLAALGFVHTGIVDDPDEGPVWEWRKTR